MDISCVIKNECVRLLVKCFGGDCTFRLCASLTSKEHSFQIKCLTDDHNYAINFHQEKINVMLLKEEVKTKFGIYVSIGK